MTMLRSRILLIRVVLAQFIELKLIVRNPVHEKSLSLSNLEKRKQVSFGD